MRKIFSFFKNLAINLLLNLWGAVPALLLLALHFVFGISVKWFLLALLIWVVYIAFRLVIITFFGSNAREF